MEELKSLRARLVIGLLIVLFVLLIGGAFLIIFGILGIIYVPWSQTWATIFLTIILPVVGALIPLSQALIASFSHKPAPDTRPAVPLPATASAAPAESSSSSLQGSKTPPQLAASSQLAPLAEKSVTGEPIPRNLPREDWGEAPHVGHFYGREKELANLKRWILDEHCQLVALLGIGGVGKSSLTAR